MEATTYKDRIRDDVRFLGSLLGEVIRQHAGEAVFQRVEQIRRLAKQRRQSGDPAAQTALLEMVEQTPLDMLEQVTRAFTAYFELINLAEDHHRVRVLRQREKSSYPRPVHDSIAAAIETLHQAGVSSETLAHTLAQLQIELVFTAHPTEAKRRTIISKLRRIGRALLELELKDLLPAEKEQLHAAIRGEITSLWVTERSRTSRPTVTDEVRMGLFYFHNTLWDVIPQIYRALDQALARFYPDLSVPERFLTFGSWIGGDRDGNPFVTTDVTATALYFHRRVAAERHHQVAQNLDRTLSVSRRVVKGVEPLEAVTERLAEKGSNHLAYLQARYPQEPFRLVAAAIADELQRAAADDVPARLRGEATAEPLKLRRRDDLLEPLHLLDNSLRQNRLDAIADTHLKDAIHLAQTFGLHTARLDIRQYSAYNRAVLDELLSKLGRAAHYADLPPAERTALLTRLLQEWPPDLSQLTGLSDEARETLALFRLLRRVIDLYGPESLGPYIVSMTNDVDDLLAVLLLARWAGVCLPVDGRDVEGLSIVPLFETLDDLDAAPRIMAALFEHPVYARHLARLGNRQMVMIGYSDSNKDAGYIAAKWYLFRAQETLVETCRKYGVELTIFHGQGGTIARGGGPTNRAILALPSGAVNGRVRLTEQGEVINDRYSHPPIARRHLEQVVNAVLLHAHPNQRRRASPTDRQRALMDELAEAGRRAYRQLVYETPELLTFWQEATPIREISLMRIGSRPARRTGQTADVASLRAIPWVFSWMQSRFVLPGWYGLGTALEQCLAVPDRLAELRQMYQTWPFFQTTIDNAQLSLGKADMGIARLYANLVEDPTIRETIYNRIHDEFARTCRAILQITGQNDILDNDPTLQRSIRLRNPYVDPLNFVQVSLLKQLRRHPNPDSPDAEPILQAIFLTINGIAAGLKNTG
ncbi:MAG: phosphoenolpyruvate carboxylase [Chloroflexi bacterium]|nr:MAG: phosphoenolpyruvate carboxylase [Chloroflexota bacterium]